MQEISLPCRPTLGCWQKWSRPYHRIFFKYFDRQYSNHKYTIFCRAWKYVDNFKQEECRFCDVAPCRYSINRHFGATYRLHFQGIRKKEKSASKEPAWAGGRHNEGAISQHLLGWTTWWRFESGTDEYKRGAVTITVSLKFPTMSEHTHEDLYAYCTQTQHVHWTNIPSYFIRKFVPGLNYWWRIGGMEVQLHHFQPQHYMQMSGQFHTPVALTPGKRPPAATVYEDM
jgi:hypothetical protein